MDGILYGEADKSKFSSTTALPQTKLIDQPYVEIRAIKTAEPGQRAAGKRAESHRPVTKPSSSNIITWDNPYLGMIG